MAGKIRENDLRLAAINEEARRRDMNYGQLVAVTTREERDEIVRRFDRVRAERMRRMAVIKQKNGQRRR